MRRTRSARKTSGIAGSASRVSYSPRYGVISSKITMAFKFLSFLSKRSLQLAVAGRLSFVISVLSIVQRVSLLVRGCQTKWTHTASWWPECTASDQVWCFWRRIAGSGGWPGDTIGVYNSGRTSAAGHSAPAANPRILAVVRRIERFRWPRVDISLKARRCGSSQGPDDFECF